MAEREQEAERREVLSSLRDKRAELNQRRRVLEDGVRWRQGELKEIAVEHAANERTIVAMEARR